jgi:hypothetical protein
MHGRRLLWVGAAVLLLCARTASAQFTTLVKYNEGPGFKLADNLVIHPGVGFATAYDTNVFYGAPDTAPVGAAYVAALFHFDLATLPPQRLEGQQPATQAVDFRLRFAGAYRNYISSISNITAQNNVDLDGGLTANFNPGGKVTFGISDDYVRSVQPQNLEGPGSYIHDYNRAGAKLGINPGGGMLTFGLGYSFLIDHYENGWSFANLNPDLTAHEFSLAVRWKFLPKTVLSLTASEGIYSRDLVLNNQRHPDSYPLRVELGLAGQLTYRLQATVKVGYGNSFYQNLPTAVSNYSNVIGGAQLKWLIDTTAALSVGYDRSFYDSIFGDFYTDDHFFGRYDHMLFGRLVLNALAGYRYRQYSGLDPEVWSISSRNDNLFEVHAGADFRIREWLFAGVAYDLVADSTSARPIFVSGGAAAPLAYNPNYTKQIISAHLEVAY